MTPAYRVGKTANLMIFLGILYSLLHLLALLGNVALAARSYGELGLGVALGVIALGYGIRYGSVGCLYIATGVFALLTVSSLYRAVSQIALSQSVRLLLSGWGLYSLCRSIPAMHFLKQTHAVPIRTSRYGTFFLRRWTKTS
jgi:hypothetical protein